MKLYVLCTHKNRLIEAIPMSTLNILLLLEDRKKKVPILSPFASCSGAMTNPQWLELPIYRTNFHGPKETRAIEVRLYKAEHVIGNPRFCFLAVAFTEYFHFYLNVGRFLFASFHSYTTNLYERHMYMMDVQQLTTTLLVLSSVTQGNLRPLGQAINNGWYGRR